MKTCNINNKLLNIFQLFVSDFSNRYGYLIVSFSLPILKRKGAEAERALINFFLLKLKSYIKTLFPTHFPDITALLFLEVGKEKITEQ